jgi:GTP cyclohydrolase I
LETVASTSQIHRGQVTTLTWRDVQNLSVLLADRAVRKRATSVFGIPTGGAIVAVMVADLTGLPLVEQPDNDTLVVDDLIDSGRTMQPFANHRHDALIRKSHSPKHLAPDACEMNGWIHFPWESNTRPDDAIIRLLEFIGDDPKREGLVETPRRVLAALQEMTEGYQQSPAQILARQFTERADEIVVLRNIQFQSLCEHHLLPFIGSVTLGYLPDKTIVGISKLARLVTCFAKRLQVQERMTTQIADAIMTHLNPKGVAVVVRANHLCMACRGVRQSETELVTSSMLGVFRDDPKARSEVMRLIE